MNGPLDIQAPLVLLKGFEILATRTTCMCCHKSHVMVNILLELRLLSPASKLLHLVRILCTNFLHCSEDTHATLQGCGDPMNPMRHIASP